MMIDVMNNVTDAYLAKYVGDNRLLYVPSVGSRMGTITQVLSATGSKIYLTVDIPIVLNDGTTVKLPTDFNTTNLIGTGSGHTGADVTYTYSTNTPVDKGIPLPAVTIPSFTIPGFTINKPTTGLTIKGYTIAQYHTVNSQVLGYTIPSYLLDTAGITVPGYTIPDLVIPAVPSLDPGVTPVMPANSYIAATGNAEPVSPTYSKSILYDEALSSWGSCDVPFKLLMDYSPVNARSINPITADVSTMYSYKNLGSSIGIIPDRGALAICNKTNPSSFVEYGDVGFSRSGVTRMLEVRAAFTQESGTRMDVYGSVNGDIAWLPMMAQQYSQNGACHLYNVLTGKWFRVMLVGEFELKHLEFSGEKGGKR